MQTESIKLYPLTQNGSVQLDQEWYRTYESLELYEDDSPFSKRSVGYHGIFYQRKSAGVCKDHTVSFDVSCFGCSYHWDIGKSGGNQEHNQDKFLILQEDFRSVITTSQIRLGRTRIEEIDRLAEATTEYLKPDDRSGISFPPAENHLDCGCWNCSV